jgi:hypothetical protein
VDDAQQLESKIKTRTPCLHFEGKKCCHPECILARIADTLDSIDSVLFDLREMAGRRN